MKMITAERHEGQESPEIERKEHESGKEMSKRPTVRGKRVRNPYRAQSDRGSKGR